VVTEPEAIRAVLVDDTFTIERIGLEAGPLSQWLYSGLAEAGLPIICVETRHMKAALSAQLNKSDRNDARGIAHMMRCCRAHEGLRPTRQVQRTGARQLPDGAGRAVYRASASNSGRQQRNLSHQKSGPAGTVGPLVTKTGEGASLPLFCINALKLALFRVFKFERDT